MDSVETQALSIKGDRGGEAYISFCDGDLCASVVVDDKQADFHFEPTTLKMFAYAYKLHCEELKKNTYGNDVDIEKWIRCMVSDEIKKKGDYSMIRNLCKEVIKEEIDDALLIDISLKKKEG